MSTPFTVMGEVSPDPAGTDLSWWAGPRAATCSAKSGLSIGGETHHLVLVHRIGEAGGIA